MLTSGIFKDLEFIFDLDQEKQIKMNKIKNKDGKINYIPINIHFTGNERGLISGTTTTQMDSDGTLSLVFNIKL